MNNQGFFDEVGGYHDEVGGYHEGGCGTAPDGTFCGECSKASCNGCVMFNGGDSHE